MSSVVVSSYRCCVFVHRVASLSAVVCVICSFLNVCA